MLYCARHDFGSFVLEKTGNLKAVMLRFAGESHKTVKCVTASMLTRD